MKIIGWTNKWNHNYKGMFSLEDDNFSWKDVEKVHKIISKELRAKGYKFSGEYHDNGDYGVPVFDNGTMYHCAPYMWGWIMADVYPEDEKNDKTKEGKWAYLPPEPEIVPSGNDIIDFERKIVYFERIIL